MSFHVFFLLYVYRELLEQVAEFEKTDFKTTNKVQKSCSLTCSTFRHTVLYLRRHERQKSAAYIDI